MNHTCQFCPNPVGDNLVCNDCLVDDFQGIHTVADDGTIEARTTGGKLEYRIA